MKINSFLWILIGINIGAVVGWIACIKFRGSIEDLMKWFDKH